MLQIGRRWGASSVSKLEPLLCFYVRIPHEAPSPQGGSWGSLSQVLGLGSSPLNHSCGLKPALLGPPYPVSTPQLKEVFHVKGLSWSRANARGYSVLCWGPEGKGVQALWVQGWPRTNLWSLRQWGAAC